MGVVNEHVKNIIGGVDFLRDVTMKTMTNLHGRVVVVGGGNTAIDAARTSLRLGAKEVILLYRRTRKEMPANDVEIVAAEEEGVQFRYLAAPVKVNSNDGVLESLECIEMELGEPDSSGRRRPVPKKGSEYELPCDFAISAIGQEPDLKGLENGDHEIEISKWNTIVAQERVFNTRREGVFAGGDVVTGPADAIDAIAAGRLAAFAIERYIETGHYESLKPIFASRKDNLKKPTPEDFNYIQPTNPRAAMHELPASERIKTFSEVELGLTPEQVMLETCRCVECGCQVSLHCALQDYCTEYSVDQARFAGEFSRYKVDSHHPYITLDPSKCITCGRCVRTCADILDIAALGFVYRGFKTVVKPAMEKHLQETNCVSCGNCVDVCPTGAIVNKMPWGRSGPWLMEKVKNVCNFCSVGCNVEINSKTPDLFYVSGAFAGEPNFGELCVKGRYGYQQLLDSNRLKKPLVRKGGELVEAAWDEAWEKISSGFKGLLAEHEDGSIMVAASPKLTDEELYLAGKLARTKLHTNNIGSFYRLMNGGEYHALDTIIGSTASTCGTQELENADLILIVNSDPTNDNPVLGWRLKRLLKKGKRAIVISSSNVEVNKYSTLWLSPRPGTSALLLTGIIARVFQKNFADEEFLRERCVGLERFLRVVVKTDQDEVTAVTGVSGEKIERCVELLGKRDQKTVAIYNIDRTLDRANNDLKALASLMLTLGKIGTEGSGLILLSNQCNSRGMELVGFDHNLLPGGSLINPPQLGRLSHSWNDNLESVKLGDQGLFSDKLANGTIKGALIFGENPAIEPKYFQQLEKLEFLVVADMFLTETTKLADVVLPLNSYVEDEGTMTNWEGRRQTINAIGEPGAGLTNLEMIARMIELTNGSKISNNHTISKVREEIAQFLPVVETEPDDNRRFLGEFPTPDGKAHFEIYSTTVSQAKAKTPNVLVLDERVKARLSQLFGQV